MNLNSAKLNLSLRPVVPVLLLICFAAPTFGQKRRIPTGRHLAVVADERLSALRASPSLSAKLIERLSRGRFVAILGSGHSHDGVTFFRVKASRRRSGWIQSDALVSATQPNDRFE